MRSANLDLMAHRKFGGKWIQVCTAVVGMHVFRTCFRKSTSSLTTLQKCSTSSKKFENFLFLLVLLSTAVGLAEMVLCQMFERICSCVRNHPLVSVESCAVKRQWLQIRLKGGFGVCLETERQAFSFELVYTRNKDVCAWPCASPGVGYHSFLIPETFGERLEGEIERKPDTFWTKDP